MRLLPQEAPDAHDRRRANAGPVVNVPVCEITPIEQAGDVPALRQRPNFRRRAKVEQQQPHLVAVARRQQRVAEVVQLLEGGVGQQGVVAEVSVSI